MKKSVIFLLIVVFLLILSGCSVATITRQQEQNPEYRELQEFNAWIILQPDYADFNDWFNERMKAEGLTPQQVNAALQGLVDSGRGNNWIAVRNALSRWYREYHQYKTYGVIPDMLFSQTRLSNRMTVEEALAEIRREKAAEASKPKSSQTEYNTAEIVMYSLLGGAFVSVLIVVLYMKLAGGADEATSSSNIPNPEADYIDAEIIEEANAEDIDYPYEDIGKLFEEAER